MKIRLLAIVLALFAFYSCNNGNTYKTKEGVDANGFAYEEVTNDPLKSRVYTLTNGLKVYLSRNDDEPRVTCLVGVRAGSSSDPEETTGLAHYFEHMMFKGTTKIGTVNWEAESELIGQLEVLFEEHRAETDDVKKKAIYKRIDSISYEASKYVATNEFDKLMSLIGGQMSNAGTGLESTVFINDVPSNELERWAILESERLNGVVLRLFHTELEAVYEEFNMYQDMDSEREFSSVMKALFPNHPYGRDVIGYPEHIKSPSMVNIENFFKTYYVPNNMAICLSGDIDFESTIQLIDKYFGSLEYKDVPPLNYPQLQPITEKQSLEIVGPESENILMAWRFDGIGSEDEKYVELIDMLLNNRQAGLMDIDLIQQQKVMDVATMSYFLSGNGIHFVSITPLEGQSLEQAEQLVLDEIEKIKNGDFDEWLIQAVVNDKKRQTMKSQESNMNRAYEMMGNFINRQSRQEVLQYLSDLEKVTKSELMAFAKEKYAVNNYVIAYKRQGENSQLVKVEKPDITPIVVNRELQSEFAVNFSNMETPEVEPVFVDFDSCIERGTIKDGCDFFYIKNQTNDLFSLRYIVDKGSWHDLEFELAVGYLPYIGTDKYSASDFQKELYKYGLDFSVSTNGERSYVTINGLNSSLDKGIELMEHILSNAKADKQAYNDYVGRILKSRQDEKADPRSILAKGLKNYGIYGNINPCTHILGAEQLEAINPDSLIGYINNISSYKHEVFYYGPSGYNDVFEKVKRSHVMPEVLIDVPDSIPFVQTKTEENKVYVVDFDINQANILLVSNTTPFDKSLIPGAQVYNNFYGEGLSSIVFQEIRESKALAYSSGSSYGVASRPGRLNILSGRIGTQADKLSMATETLVYLMNNCPDTEQQYKIACESLAKVMRTERITKENIFWTWKRNHDRGIDYDIRKDEYDAAINMSYADFLTFFDQNIKDQKFAYLVLGRKSDLNIKALEALGSVEFLTVDDLFGE